MWIDKRSEFVAGQALTAGTTTPLTNSIDFGGDYDQGPGAAEAYWVLGVDVADTGGTTSTYDFALETADDAAFTTNKKTIASLNVPHLTPIGKQYTIGFPWANQRYVRVMPAVVNGNGTAAITVSSFLTKEKPPAWQAYPQKLNV